MPYRPKRSRTGWRRFCRRMQGRLCQWWTVSKTCRRIEEPRPCRRDSPNRENGRCERGRKRVRRKAALGASSATFSFFFSSSGSPMARTVVISVSLPRIHVVPEPSARSVLPRAVQSRKIGAVFLRQLPIVVAFGEHDDVEAGAVVGVFHGANADRRKRNTHLFQGERDAAVAGLRNAVAANDRDARRGNRHDMLRPQPRIGDARAAERADEWHNFDAERRRECREFRRGVGRISRRPQKQCSGGVRPVRHDDGRVRNPHAVAVLRETRRENQRVIGRKRHGVGGGGG